MSTDHTAELDTAIDLARWACARIRLRPEVVESKRHPADHVTETDREVELHVRSVLTERFPDHSIVGEEYGGSVDGRPTWYLDPVDGTTNYAHGLPWSSFSLALIDDDGPLVGVVADPYRDETFSAARDQPALRNGDPVTCSQADDLAGQIVTTEWAGVEPWDGMQLMLEQLSARFCSVRIMGSTALSLVNVAAGRAAACVIGRYHAIDGLAASFIAERAGAVGLAEDGTRTVFPDKGGILVAAPGVVDVMQDIWRGRSGERP